ncbi:MAG: HlyD family efflux transporter periplasmic adaptor subunit, partial [Planctomycetota bacterium]
MSKDSTDRRSATLHLVQSSRFARRLAKLLLIGLVVAVAAMAFLPWQQTSRGAGQVVAFVPQERQQTVQSPTKGVVARIADGLVEGSQVSQGDFILEIQPISAGMREQLQAQLLDLKTKRRTAEVKAESYGNNVIAYASARESVVKAAQQMVESSKAKLAAKRKQVVGYEAKELQARLNYERQQELRDKGLKPVKEIEKLKKDWDVAISDVDSVNDEVDSLINEVAAKEAELEKERLLAQTKIDSAVAMQQDALGIAASVDKEIRDINIKLGELNRLVITAPRDGTIFRMPVYEQGRIIKEGEPILTIVPESSQKAVELWVNGNDMPLVEEGQEVRLQFEGWPAVQFAGWPSVAVGTFSGMVANVDATDNGKGQFRVLVTESPLPDVEAWPSDRFLRQGVRTNGWVMLRNVSLGYEIWRQLNGFPVIVSTDEPNKDKKK